MTNCSNAAEQVSNDTQHVILKMQIVYAIELSAKFINTKIKSRYSTLPFYFSRIWLVTISTALGALL
jgi:hypothetical protein